MVPWLRATTGFFGCLSLLVALEQRFPSENELPQLIHECRTSHNENRSCEVYAYAEAVYKLDRELSVQAAKSSSAGNEEIPVLSEWTYQKFFVDYALAHRPVLLGLDSSVASVYSQDAANIIACTANYEWSNTGSHEALDLCKLDTSKWNVPEIIANNYLVRLSHLAMSGVASLYWPHAIHFTGDGNSYMHSCPWGMHAGFLSLLGSTNVSLFATSSLVHMGYRFASSQGEPLQTVQIAAMNSTVSASHYGAMDSGHILFVPGMLWTSFRSTSEALILKFCVLDASNYYRVYEEISLSYAVDARAKSVLASLSHSSLDLSMARIPSALAWNEFITWPRPTVHEDSDESRSPSRSSRGRSTFRDWQESSRWNTLTSSLTLPRLDTPKVMAHGRTCVTVQWISRFVRRPEDETRYGYNLTVYRETLADGLMFSSFIEVQESELSGQVLLTESVSMGAKVSSFNYTVLDLQPDTSYHFRVSVFYGEHRSIPSKPSLYVRTNPISAPSTATNVTISSVGSTYVTLRFDAPDNDGGLPILGFHVYAKHQERHHHDGWVFRGTFRACQPPPCLLQIAHLLPQSLYKFKVAAFNSKGNSTDSDHSPAVMTLEARNDFIAGIGHEERLSSNFGVSPGPLHRSISSVITLDVSSQTVQVRGIQTFSAWSCYFGPLGIKVSAEIVLSNPEDGSDTLQNANDVHGRIVAMRRGSISFVDKALRAQVGGGLGVIIIDDGRCTNFDQVCLPGADKSKGELFARLDTPRPWLLLRIPTVFMLRSEGESLLKAAGVSIGSSYGDEL